MIHWAEVFFTVGIWFKVTSLVVVRLFNSTNRSYSDGMIALRDLKNTGSSHVIDIWGNPTTVVKISQQNWCLVVASYKNCQKGSFQHPCIVLVKITHRPVLRRTSKSLKIGLVSNTLKISTADNQIYVLAWLFKLLVHFSKLSMKTTNLRNDHLPLY